MPKILLVNPPFNIQKATYDTSISVGLLCLGSYLAEKGIDAAIIDGLRQSDYMDILRTELPSADFVGLSVMTTQIPKALEISQLAKEVNKNIKVIWGGLHPTFFARETLASDLVDFVVMKEGEKSSYGIIKAFDDSYGQQKIFSENTENLFRINSEKTTEDKLRSIPGIGFKDENKIIINKGCDLPEMSEIPLPRWGLMDKKVLENLNLAPTHTSRGCPHLCTFCVNAITQNRWRARGVEQVIDDLKVLKNSKWAKGKKLRFWDENFFVNKERARKIIQRMIEENLGFEWETTVRANYIRHRFIDDEFLSDMKKSGCYLLSFGAESGSPRILEKIKKGVTREELLNSAKRCLYHGIIPQYSFMCGLPGETKEDMMMTIDLIKKLTRYSPKVQILGPQAFRPYPGSPLYEECLAAGWQGPNTLEEWNNVLKNELNYLDIRKFPWIEDVDLVESLEAYVRFGAHPIKNAMSSTVQSNKWLKLGFVLVCKLRWRLGFFGLPYDFRLAKKAVTNQA